MTAITLLGDPDYQKYTKYLPLAGKNGGVTQLVECETLNLEVEGSNPSTPTNNKSLTKINNDEKHLDN